VVKISLLNKRLRQKGPQAGGASCTDCFKGRHEECERSAFVFCNCWRSKHLLPKNQVHQTPKSLAGKVRRKPVATKKG
jgi:hypothetical protein